MNRDEINKLAKNIEQHAFKRGYVSAFTLTAFPEETDDDLVLHITRECDGLVYGNAEVASIEAFTDCVKSLDGRVDYIVCDTALQFDVSDFFSGKSKPKKSILLPYSDLSVWIESVRYMLLAIVPDLLHKNIVLVGLEHVEDMFLARLSIDLAGICGRVAIHFHDSAVTSDEQARLNEEYKNADIILGAAIYSQVITIEQLAYCEKSVLIVDAGIGTITPEAARHAGDRGFELLRVDNRAAMAGMLFSLIQSHDLVTRVMGKGEIDGIPVVAGGVIGSAGTIVVDSIDNPSMAIGFADGTGRIRYLPVDEIEYEKLNRVKKAIGEQIDE